MTEREGALLERTGALMNESSIAPESWNRTTGKFSPGDFVDRDILVAQFVLIGLTNVCLQGRVESGGPDSPGTESRKPRG